MLKTINITGKTQIKIWSFHSREEKGWKFNHLAQGLTSNKNWKNKEIINNLNQAQKDCWIVEALIEINSIEHQTHRKRLNWVSKGRNLRAGKQSLENERKLKETKINHWWLKQANIRKR